MMAVRERAAAAMAALERRVPGVEDFVGQSWSSWVEKSTALPPEGPDAEECGKNGRKKAEAMTLRKEDMCVFGHCPALDDFYLVVCSHCGQVVKPQAFERHCERRHGSVGKPCRRPRTSTLAPVQRQRPAASHAATDGKHQGTGPSLPCPLAAAQRRVTKAQKDAAGHSAPHRVSQAVLPGGCSSRQSFLSASSPRSPAPNLKDPPWHEGSAVPSGATLLEKALPQKGEPGQLGAGLKANKKISKKECDLDKHCGVLDLERKKLCTRLLTCNIHSIHQRRKVVGRSKNFDQLVAELKMVSKTRERVNQSKEDAEHKAVSPKPSEDNTGPLPCGKPPVNCLPIRSRTPWEGEREEERPCTENLEIHSISPLAQEPLSSEESEGESTGAGLEEPAAFDYTPWHPRPLGLCTFGSHALGLGIFTFDRRLHCLRSALRAMVEQHLASRLWRKVPSTALQTLSPGFSTHGAVQGSHSARSLRTSPVCSPGKAAQASSCSPSPGDACEVTENPPDRQLVTAPHLVHTSPVTPLTHGRSHTFVCRPSKRQAQLKEAEPMTSSHKRKAMTQEPRGSDRNCAYSDPRRTVPTPHGLVNGALLTGNKQHTPVTPSESHPPSQGMLKRAAIHPPPEPAPLSPSLQGRGAGRKHSNPGRKHKSNLSPPPKFHRPSAAPNSNFFSAKESKSLERKLSTQKPKLLH